MKIIEKHGLDETILTSVLGWKWISFIGTPTHGTEGYPKKRRVRQLFSPKQLKDANWIKFLDENEAEPANGGEPLSYAHSSSAGPAIPPRLFILVDDSWSG